MRRPFIAANWKMNKTVGETHAYLNEFIPLINDITDVDIVIAPPFTSLYTASLIIKNSKILLASQNVFYEQKGAYTGEISPLMLRDIGCKYAIIGHSERRQYFHETDEIINKKINASIKNGINVIFCIGESLEEREAGKTFGILERQLDEGLKDVSSYNDIVIAYEPIWAIGTGKTATPEQAQEAHKFIRERLSLIYGNKADEIRIIYGGSVTPDNIDSLMACNDIDGALVGGASLNYDSFAKIVKFQRGKQQ